jgi:hypothetical protein
VLVASRRFSVWYRKAVESRIAVKHTAPELSASTVSLIYAILTEISTRVKIPCFENMNRFHVSTANMLLLAFPIWSLSRTRYAEGSFDLKGKNRILVMTGYMFCLAFYSPPLALGASPVLAAALLGFMLKRLFEVHSAGRNHVSLMSWILGEEVRNYPWEVYSPPPPSNKCKVGLLQGTFQGICTGANGQSN